MIALVQRVKSCAITNNNAIYTQAGAGLLVYIGIEDNDSGDDINFIVHKIINLRIFNDKNKKMNYSVSDINGDIMIVSQFTLCADVNKGLRPSFIKAMPIDEARSTYNILLDKMEKKYKNTYSGIFQADMLVDSINDGPVTMIIRSNTVESN